MAAAVLEAVDARAAGRRVRGVRLHVGALQRLDRAVFDQAFAMIADGGVARDAAVDVVEVAVEVRCRACGAATTGEELITTCPRCEDHDLELLHGDDLVLASITLAGRDVPARPEQEVG